MLSIKPLLLCLCSSFLTFLLFGCAGTAKEADNKTVEPVHEQLQATSESQQSEFQAGKEVQPEVAQTSPGGQQAGPQVVVETEAEIRERNRLLQLQQFGPDPYMARAPMVPEQAKADFAVAMDVLNSGDTVAAEAEFVKLVETYPMLSGPAYNLAVMKVAKEDYKGALDYIETALSRNYYNLQARALKAFLHRESGDFKSAEKEYLEIIQLWGAFLPAYKNLGILYDLYMGRIEDALVYYKKYNDLLPEPDKQVLGWSMDIERQLAEKQSRSAAAAEAEAIQAAAVADSAKAVSTDSGTDSGTENPAGVQSSPNEGGQEPQ